MVWNLNQGNPSIKFAMDYASGQGRICLSFFMPFATVCNHLQPEAFSMVKNRHFGSFIPIFPDLTGLKPPKVSRGTSGKPLPHQLH